MRLLKFVLALAATLALAWALNRSFTAGLSPVPPLGKLLDPFGGFWQNIESAPALPGELALPGLDAEASVIYDERLVPHLYAQNDKDAAYLQGYVTAQHRLWQMDFSTRAAAGRLSEVLGEALLPYDKGRRRLGMVYGAENALKRWQDDKANFALVEAYAQGVNDYIATLAPKDYPLEFKILNYAPEAWSPLKSALFLMSMSDKLSSQHDDLEAGNTLALLGRDSFFAHYPHFWEGQSPIIPAGTAWPSEGITQPDSSRSLIGGLRGGSLDWPKADRNNGSNNWAVAGSKTANGAPILCGDPHLSLSLPAIWYEIHISTPEYSVYGVSLPGMPNVIIGFNEQVAWTVTNVGHDVLDWYAVDWTDASHRQYRLDGQVLEARPVVERFEVRGTGTVYDTVPYTVWGPTLLDPASPLHGHSVKWLAHDAPGGSELSVFSKLNRAKNYDDYAAALENYNVPAQNFCFAAADGDIALKVQGLFPLRRQGQGRFIQDGSRADSDWKGFVPKAHNPMVKNPERGFVSSANQHSTAPDYPYFYFSEGFDAYRGRTVNRFLAEMDSITVEDMQRLQTNDFVLRAAENLPLLLDLLQTQALDEQGKAWLEKLRAWDYYYDKDAFAPILFERWYYTAYDMATDEWEAKDAKGEAVDVIHLPLWRFTQLLAQPGHAYFDIQDTPLRETASDIATQAYQKAAAELAEWLAEHPDGRWGQFHPTKVEHLGRIKPFGRYGLNTGGNRHALNAINNGHAPSWRMIVELGQPVRAWVVFPGGESGHPGSRYYDNFVDTWASKSYYEALFWRQPPAAGSQGVLAVQQCRPLAR